MPKYFEKIDSLTLPVIPLRGLVAFPGTPINFELQREISINAANAALDGDMYVLLVSQKDIAVDEPTAADLYKTGCISKIRHTLKTPEGTVRVIAEGVCRGIVTSLFESGGYFTAEVMSKMMTSDHTPSDVRAEALMREATSALSTILNYLPSVSSDMTAAARSVKNPGQMADFIAAGALVRYQDKQEVLECIDPMKRLELVTVLLENETKLLKTEMQIHKKVKEQMDENQRDYYLREQMKVIQSELGIDSSDDVAEYYEKIESAVMPEEVKKKLLKEVSRLAKTPFGSPEATVSRNYLDVCLDIPWGKTTSDRLNIAAAKKILDADHAGLTDIKDRIIEYLAVKKLNPELKNQILCFVGPPGVGKTSLGISIARAMKRKYVRISLGGVRDESDIRGHRKTYIGSMPGRIINAIIDAGVMNPLIQLDEVDKLGSDIHGDPSSALLEVLDSEQNKAFRDHFVEIPVDLSDCIFIATANTLETVPAPLIDRMEIIELHTYTPTEKMDIAKRFLVPKQLKRHGLTGRTCRIKDDAISELIDGYTRESGVRNLEREISSICRKAARRIASEEAKTVTVDREEVGRMLGGRRFVDDDMYKTDPVGVVNGLAYTEVGGDVLKIETAVMEGTGKLELTGTLGDVMKESAKIAVSYIRAHSGELCVDANFYKTRDIHIHVPEGAVPKDGPSAGVTIVSSLVSTLTGRRVRCDTAMTGEITLTGRVLPIGGLREKATAAYNAGIKRIIIPKQNVKDLEKLDPEVRGGVTFIPCVKIDEVLESVLRPRDEVPAPQVKKTSSEADEQTRFRDPAEVRPGRRRGRSKP